jgi:hypothetical protein
MLVPTIAVGFAAVTLLAAVFGIYLTLQTANSKAQSSAKILNWMAAVGVLVGCTCVGAVVLGGIGFFVGF